jgi:hypothetical protein
MVPDTGHLYTLLDGLPEHAYDGEPRPLHQDIEQIAQNTMVAEISRHQANTAGEALDALNTHP